MLSGLMKCSRSWFGCWLHGVFLVAQMVKKLPEMQETWIPSLGWEDPLEKGVVTPSRSLAGRIHGQRSLVDYSSWGRKELSMTEQYLTSLHGWTCLAKLIKHELYVSRLAQFSLQHCHFSSVTVKGEKIIQTDILANRELWALYMF